jgi:hypothetical protein
MAWDLEGAVSSFAYYPHRYLSAGHPLMPNNLETNTMAAMAKSTILALNFSATSRLARNCR